MAQSAQMVHSSSTIHELEEQDKKSCEGSAPPLDSIEEVLSALSQASDGEGQQVVLDKFFNSIISSEGKEETDLEQGELSPNITEFKHSSRKIVEDHEDNLVTFNDNEEISPEQNMSVTEDEEKLNEFVPETDEDFQNMLRESAENFENVLKESTESFQQMLRESVESFRNEIQEPTGNLDLDEPRFSEDLQSLLSDPPNHILQDPNETDEVVTIHVRRKRKASAMDSNILTELSHLGNEDPDRMFLLSVVPDLKRIRRDKVDDVKLKILKVLKKNKSVSTIRSSVSSLKSISSGAPSSNDLDLSKAEGELHPDPEQLIDDEPLLMEEDEENFDELGEQ